MKPSAPLVSFRMEGRYQYFLSLVSALGLFGFLAYFVLFETGQYWVLAIASVLLYLAYLFSVAIFNETLIWEEDGYLKKYSGPIPEWERFDPIATTDIVGFFWTTERKDNVTLDKINVKLASGAVRTIHQLRGSQKALDAVDTLTRKCRGGAIQKLQERSIQRVTAQRNGTRGGNGLRYHIACPEDLVASLRRQAVLIGAYRGPRWEIEILQSELKMTIEMNEALFRSVIPTIAPENENLLYHAYAAMTEDVIRWRDLLVSEMERQLEYATATKNTEYLSALDAYSLISIRRGREVRRTLRNLIETGLGSPVEEIRGAAVRLLIVLSDGHVHGTINTLKTVIRSDPSWRVRYIAGREIECLNPSERSVQLADRFRARLRPVLF